jgi:FkbM family methyltransferase
VSVVDLAKQAIGATIAAPGVRQGLRWFLQQRSVPKSWRDYAHSRIAKRARFAGRRFSYTTSNGTALTFLHTGAPNYLFWLGEYEPETVSLFLDRARTANVILDIGAADGIFALFAAAANPAARVLAFEPGAEAAATLAANLELNPDISEKIELQRLALGNEDGQATLYVAGRNGGTSSLDPTFRAVNRPESVGVRRGDSLLPELGIERVDLIKIDTESTEPAVLQGLAHTLERDRPDIICEVLHGRTERQLEAILKPLGYSFFWISADGLLPRDQIVGDPTYAFANYLFTASKSRTASL